MSEAQLDDLRRIVLRTINKNQILILTHIPRIPTSITSVLRELSKKYQIPLSTLKRNAQILRDLNLISYGEAPNFSGVELTELGRFISGLMMSDELTLKIGRRGAGLLLQQLRVALYRVGGQELLYLKSICQQLESFIDTLPPKEIQFIVVSVDGVPVDGLKEDQKKESRQKESRQEGKTGAEEKESRAENL